MADIRLLWAIISDHMATMALIPYSDLHGISAFVQTVDAGSFTAAANRMGLSKSAIGKAVARLETRLGVRLLERTTRTLGLTAEGQSYYRTCLSILADLHEAETLIASSRREISGRLRVGLSVAFGRRWVMPILCDLVRQHPRLDLDVSFTDREVDLVEEGIDLVVRLGRPGNQAILMRRKLGVQRNFICASPGYIAQRGAPASVAELGDHICIGFARGRVLPWLVCGPDGHPTQVQVAHRHVISDGEAYREAVVNGLGVGQLPTWLAADDLRDGRLVALFSAEPVEAVEITALWPHSRALTPKLRATIDALVEAFLPDPPWDNAIPGPV